MKCPRCGGTPTQGGGGYRYCPRCRWSSKNNKPKQEIGTTRLGEHPKRTPDGRIDVEAEEREITAELKRVGLKR